MKKKYLILSIAAVFSLALLTSCHNKSKSETVLTQSSSRIGSTAESNNRDSVRISDCSAIIVNLNSLRCNKIEEYDYNLLISFIHDGRQLIERYDYGSDYEWFYPEITEHIAEAKDMNYILAKDYYDENSTGYDDLNGDEVVFQYTDELTAVNKVKYIDYKEDESEPHKAWIDYFSDVLEENDVKSNTPIIISESWEFELSSKQAAIVTASNAVPNEEFEVFEYNESCGIEPVDVQSDNPIMYTITTIFIDGKAIMIQEPHILQVGKLTSPPTTEEEGPYGVMFFAYQFDDSSNIVKMPIYDNMISEYASRDYGYSPSFFVMDLDRNGQDEIIVYNNSWTALQRYVYVNSYNGDSLDEYIAWTSTGF